MRSQIHLFKYAEHRFFTFRMVRAREYGWKCEKCNKLIERGTLYLWSQTRQHYGNGVRMHLACADKLTCIAQQTIPNWGQLGKLEIEKKVSL
jgi:hypothetical protein